MTTRGNTKIRGIRIPDPLWHTAQTIAHEPIRHHPGRAPGLHRNMGEQMTISNEAVEAAAYALDPRTMGSGGALAEKFKAETRAEARRILEAAAPHMLAAKVAEARANNDHIIEGVDGYSAGFHYALHCIEPTE